MGILNEVLRQTIGMDMKYKKKKRKQRRGGPKLSVRNVFYQGKPHGIFFNGEYHPVKKK